MTTIITVAGVDASSNSLGFMPPVSNGLLAWFHLGGDAAQTVKNKASGGADGTIFGAPTFSPGYMSSPNQSNRLDTTTLEMAACTLFAVARSNAAFSSTTTRPTLAGTYASYLGGPPAGAALQVTATPSVAPAATVVMTASRDNAGAPAMTPASITVANFSQFTFLAGTCAAGATADARAIYDMTHGVNAKATPATARLVNTGQTIRFGNMTSLNAGPCDVAFGAVYNRVLTLAEITSVHDFVARRLLDKFGIVV